MSSSIFPSFAGVDVAIKRSTIYATKVQTSASGKELRATFQATPIYKWDLKMNFLRQAGYNTATDEVAQLGQLFVNLKGAWDSFLFTDTVDNTVTLRNFGTGTGALTTFQLCDGLGVPIYDLNGTASIYVNGVLKTVTTDYSISATGLVTFVAAPANTYPLTWSGSFYRRVRFDGDEQALEQIAANVWAGGTLKMILVK